MSYITTFTKKHFDPINIDINNIDIKDIAHALSLLCRANGHFKHFYSVAQHSLNCAKEAKARGYSKRVRIGCLLHDASEAYLSDVTRPMKEQLPKYLEIEENLQNAIFDKWITPTLTDEERKLVFEIDDEVLYHEFLHLMDEKISDTEPQIKAMLDVEIKDIEAIENRFTHEFYTLTESKEKCWVGADWMHGKWLAVELSDTNASVYTFESISELCEFYENINTILIDVPIGLPETAEEAEKRPDQEARDFLKNKNRKSSIFNTPFRPLVYAKNQADFWDLAKKLGNKVTSQSYAIINCIREADEFLSSNPVWKNRLLESHPECAFQALNNGNGIEHSKHTEYGIALRTEILSKYVDNIKMLVDSVSGKDKEDILDACSLAVTAKLGFKTIPKDPKTDKNGIKMQIAVADIV